MSKHDPFAPLGKAGVAPGSAEAAAAPAREERKPATETKPASAEVPKAQGSDVPEGTVKEVLNWVGDDKEKAQKALDAENATGEPRKSLVAELEEKLA